MGKITHRLLLFLTALFVILGGTVIVSQAANSSPKPGQARAASIRGETTIQGERVIVEVVVAVRPGEDPKAAARAALRRAYPDVREIEEAEFSTNGLVWDNFTDTDTGNDQVLVRYNPNGVPANLSGLNHRTVWVNAQATWSEVARSSFRYKDGGNTGKCPSLVRECKGPQNFDGNNDVGWLDINDPSVLGVTWYSTSIDEFDMVLDNKDFSWYIGDPSAIPANAFDAETVWLHEFGHGLGLGHSAVDGAVMEPYYESVRRALDPDDVEGIAFLYPAGALNASPVVTITNPADGASFASGTMIVFEGTAIDSEDGELTGSLSWTSSIDGSFGVGGSISVVLSDGDHTINASTTDSGGGTGSDSISLRVGSPPTEATKVTVTSITYATEGGKNSDRHLSIRVYLKDDLGNSVANASVAVRLDNTTTGQSWTGFNVSGADGSTLFSLKNASSGIYTTTVTDVTASGLTWDGITPQNSFTK